MAEKNMMENLMMENLIWIGKKFVATVAVHFWQNNDTKFALNVKAERTSVVYEPMTIGSRV